MRLSRSFTRPCLGAAVVLLAGLPVLGYGKEGMPARMAGALMAARMGVAALERLDAPVEAVYACAECGWRTWTPRALERHRRRHGNERPYACQECFMAFNAPGNLRRHMRTHPGLEGPAMDQANIGAMVDLDLPPPGDHPGGAAEEPGGGPDSL
jgi:hypothetical protein